MFRSRRLLLPLLLVLSLALSACAERATDTGASPSDSESFPVRLHPEGAPEVTLEQRPDRIVSLSPSSTEVLFAVGAGDQVVAVDEMSTHPEQAPRTELSGLNPDPEAIAGHDPDLVIVESDSNAKLRNTLAQTGTKTLVLPAPESLASMYRRFELVGEATGHAEAGAELAHTTKTEIDRLAAETKRGRQELTYYHELSPSLHSATSATFIGKVYSLFGLTNIADQGDPTAHGGYPQLPAERILEADPDLIVLADTRCCGQTPGTVAQRPGWDTLTAVKRDQVVGVDDDLASRWGPRLVEFVRAVSDAVTRASA